jgi:gas vesicle protein
MSNTMTIELPMNDITTAFLEMDEETRIRVIELGTIFLAKGGDTVQAWTSAEWDKKMTETCEEHKAAISEWKKENLMLQARNRELQQDISNVAQSQNDAIRRAIDTNKTQYESVIQRLTTEMETMRSQTADRESMLRRTIMGEMDVLYGNQLADIRVRTDKRIEGLERDLAVSREKYEQLIVSTNSRAQNSSVKGRDGEDFVFANLNRMFPSAEVEDTHNTPARGDFIVRDKGMCMMIENKYYGRNVSKAEIDKFYRDVDTNEDIQCAILVSMTSGVANKEDFEFEMRGGKPLLFLHNVETAIDNIKVGANFFRMILAQTQVDFTDKEVVTKLTHFSGVIRKEIKKQKTLLEKYHASHMKQIDEMVVVWEEMFAVLCLK